jgi:hypothetical protein
MRSGPPFPYNGAIAGLVTIPLAQAEVMALGLDAHAGGQQPGDLLGRGSGPQRRAQIDVLVPKKTEPQPSVGGQANAVAALAVVVGEGADHAHRTGRAGVGEVTRRTVAGRTGHRLDPFDSRDPLENLVR